MEIFIAKKLYPAIFVFDKNNQIKFLRRTQKHEKISQFDFDNKVGGFVKLLGLLGTYKL